MLSYLRASFSLYDGDITGVFATHVKYGTYYKEERALIPVIFSELRLSSPVFFSVSLHSLSPSTKANFPDCNGN